LKKKLSSHHLRVRWKWKVLRSLQLSYAHQLPVVAIRVISDTTKRDLPIRMETMVDVDGTRECWRRGAAIVRHPLQLPALIRLGRESSTAAEAWQISWRHSSRSFPSAPWMASAGSARGRGAMSGTGTVFERSTVFGPIPKTMRAGVYREKGIVRVEEVAVPEVGDREVLIKVAACGICGTDIKKIFQRYVEPPQILGHELAGTVVAVGAGVTKWKPGDRVMSFHHTPCGTCFYCQKRSFSQCKQYKTTGLTGGFTPNWRRVWRIREGDALGGRARHRGTAGQRELRGSHVYRANQHDCEGGAEGTSRER
jgi:hypothetical protein